MPAVRTRATRNARDPHSDKYTCDRCPFSTNNSTSWKRHDEGHGERTLKCPYEDCDFKTYKSLRYNLTVHMNRHSEQKPHKCLDDPTNCHFATADPSSLLRHRKALHGYVPNSPERSNARLSKRKDAQAKEKSKPKPRHVPRKVVESISEYSNPEAALGQFSTFKLGSVSQASGTRLPSASPSDELSDLSELTDSESGSDSEHSEAGKSSLFISEHPVPTFYATTPASYDFPSISIDNGLDPRVMDFITGAAAPQKWTHWSNVTDPAINIEYKLPQDPHLVVEHENLNQLTRGGPMAHNDANLTIPFDYSQPPVAGHFTPKIESPSQSSLFSLDFLSSPSQSLSSSSTPDVLTHGLDTQYVDVASFGFDESFIPKVESPPQTGFLSPDYISSPSQSLSSSSTPDPLTPGLDTQYVDVASFGFDESFNFPCDLSLALTDFANTSPELLQYGMEIPNYVGDLFDTNCVAGPSLNFEQNLDFNSLGLNFGHNDLQIPYGQGLPTYASDMMTDDNFVDVSAYQFKLEHSPSPTLEFSPEPFHDWQLLDEFSQ